MKKHYLLGGLLLAMTAAKAQNSGITFDGINDYINCGNTAAVSASSIRTMECWVKFNSLSGDREILSKSVSSAGLELLQFGGNLAVYAMYNGSNASFITYPMSNLKTGTWYHIAFSWNGTKESMRLYVNGASVGNLNHVGNINTTGVANPACNFRIGEWSATPARPFSGSIDEVRLWSVNRTALEIKLGMYKVPAVNTSGLIAAYSFNEGSGTTAQNSTAQTGLNGTLTNGPVWTTSPVQGSGNALHFDGIDDQVVVSPNPKLDLTTGTVECWIKPGIIEHNGCIIAVRGEQGTRFSFHINTMLGTIGLWNQDSYRTVSYPFVPGTWYHVAFVCDGTNTLFYINGQHVGQSGSAFSNITGQPLTIGVAKDASQEYEEFWDGIPGADKNPVLAVTDNEFYNGEIDEVRIWNTQRTALEIAAQKDVSLTGSEPGLLAQYSFNQGIAGNVNTGLTELIDQSGNNLHGTLSNFSLSSGSSNYTSHTMMVLPVRWAGFTATKKGSAVVLQWETAFEQNSRLFSVERSSDGSSFSAIATVPAAGKAGVYSFTDMQPLPGTGYYRIRQIDLDGRAQQSAVCAVNFQPAGAFTWMNHQNGSCTLLLKGGDAELFTISDMAGRLLESGKLSGGRKTVQLPRGGTYVATVVRNGETLTTRLVVL